MSGWRHDRNYYANMAKVSGIGAIYCFCFSIIFLSISALESFDLTFLLPGLLLFVLGISFIRWRIRCRDNFCRAPSVFN